MQIGIKEGIELKAYWIAKQGITQEEAEETLAGLRGATSVYIGRKSALDDLGNTYYNY